jgi:uncharacterized UBP type Zn finger protein
MFVLPYFQADGSKQSAGDSDDDEAHPLYTLYAVIIHSGNSANVGHYYAFARGLYPQVS